MSGFVDRAISAYRKEGLLSLARRSPKIAQYYYRVVKGSYTLSIGESAVSFSAPTFTAAKRNDRRFESEKEELSAFLREIESKDVVYDIGANTGLYTLFSAKRCPDGQVVAFEPYPPNTNLLRQELSRNRIDNVRIFEMALSNSVGMITFNQPKQDDVGYGSSSITAEESEATLDVSTTTGDQLIADGEIPEPNVVKIDVEGAEPLVLEGLENALSSDKCRILYCEVHLPGVEFRPSIADFDATPKSIKDFIRECGFSLEQVRSSENEMFIMAQK